MLLLHLIEEHGGEGRGGGGGLEEFEILWEPEGLSSVNIDTVESLVRV